MNVASLFGVLVVVLYFLTARAALAIPPPDFLFNVGSQVVQFFSIAVIMMTAVFGLAWSFVRRMMTKRKATVLAWTMATITVLLCGVGAWQYGLYDERMAFKRWMNEMTPETVQAVSSTVQTVSSTLLLVLSPPLADLSMTVSNKELTHLLDTSSTTPIFILDARENIEVEYGHFPGSTHIRFADLRAGRWTELPMDRSVIVLCWSGIRGKEVAEFLRTKNVRAQALADGAKGWVDAGGVWIGKIKFLDVYTAKRYSDLLSKKELQEELSRGAVIVDARSRKAFEARHDSPSIRISIMATPTDVLEKTLAEVPEHSRVITACDEYVNCFDAKILGVELERRGHEFIGRVQYPE